VRIDKWLWFARFYKSRSLAAAMVEEGEVLLNGAAVTKPAREVKAGDEIEMPLGRMRRKVRVVSEGERRGPAPEAQGLYEIIF
jgi:ribosome-associated heat shock protein Hsp15